ncbi:MAG: hypothetical protein ING19_21185 [Azospirillum sp.]|nr:hypothetical protein [Azospirillum sp.]
MTPPPRIAWTLDEVAEMLGYRSGRTVARALAKHPEIGTLGVGRGRRLDAAAIAALTAALKGEAECSSSSAAPARPTGSSAGPSAAAVSRKLQARRLALRPRSCVSPANARSSSVVSLATRRP